MCNTYIGFPVDTITTQKTSVAMATYARAKRGGCSYYSSSGEKMSEENDLSTFYPLLDKVYGFFSRDATNQHKDEAYNVASKLKELYVAICGKYGKMGWL